MFKTMGRPGKWAWWLASGALLALTYVLALVFVLPGRLDPIAIPHSDLYMPLAIANAPYNPAMPRPVGALFDFWRGQFGLSTSILMSLCVVFANCLLTVHLLRRWMIRNAFPIHRAGLLLGLALYGWSVFTHPFFYIFAAWDAYAQISYLCLGLGWLWWCRFEHRRWLAGAGFLVLVTVAFLAKETYIASFLLLLGFFHPVGKTPWAGAGRREPLWRVLFERRNWWLPVLACVGFLAAFAVGRALKSPFTSDTAFADDAYKISLAPLSVLREWFRYLKDGWSGWNLLALCLVVVAARRVSVGRSLAWPCALLIFAGVLAWLPNATLPNHHFGLYSFTGSYLTYAPILLLCASFGFRRGNPGRKTSLLFGLCVLLMAALPLLNQRLYKRSEVAFYLAQTERQAQLVQSLEALSTQLPKKNARVLLTGIVPPFNPFDHPAAFHGFFPTHGLQLDVLAYGHYGRQLLEVDDGSSQIRRIHAPDLDMAVPYDAIWRVDFSGRVLAGQAPSDQTAVSMGLTRDDLTRYPVVAQLLAQPGAATDPYALLECGQALLRYDAPRLALACLQQSSARLPSNPHPAYILGLAYEQLELWREAEQQFERAVRVDDPAQPNPVFSDALARVARRPAARLQ